MTAILYSFSRIVFLPILCNSEGSVKGVLAHKEQY